ncbi:MAG: amino acid adenylation domain-containing protein, partial [Bacillota bacterium]|nr:amino acid adenylation domain-containing protein [Bacillota bacterium]
AKSKKYEYAPLAEIQARTLLKNTLIDHIMIFENYPILQQDKNLDNSRNLKVKLEEGVEQTNYNLNIIIAMVDEIMLKLNYNGSVYDEQYIKMISKHIENVLKEVTENPEKKISEIEMLTEEERQKILFGFNDTKAEYPKDKTIYELFEEQVEKTPENIAVVYEEKELSYRELNEKANQLARVLREKGVGPDKIVGIMVERSLEMIVGIMGIIKAGGAYLPIDPEYPKERIEYMLEDSKADILLTQTQLVGKSEFSGNIIKIDREDLYVGESSNLQKANTSSALAYVIYTSGSTGKPKGVMIEHRSVINFICGTSQKVDITRNYTILALTTMSFDIFLLETLLPLVEGMKVIVVSDKAKNDAVVLNEIITKNNVNIIQATPSRVSLLTNKYKDATSLSKVKKLLIGGEALPENLLKMFKEIKSTEIFNMYGPTETTVWSSISQVTHKETITIGKPIANTRIYIVDKNNKLQPVGVPGELCISGDGLARGYLNRPELTEEKFIPNPYKTGERLYKTGDLARWLPDGNIEFIGRIDHQVKIRGFRIELGEIESQLLKHEEIKEAVVIDRADKEGNKHLCAYVVSDKEITVTELREHLAKELPDYMIPAYFIQLENIPLTPNGKINRKALPEPEGEINIGVEYAAPRNEVEEKIVKVWSEILGVEKIGIDDNFFVLGGHSIKALDLASKLNGLNISLKVSEVYTYPTIRKITDFIKLENLSISIKEDIVDNLVVNESSNIIKGINSNNDQYSWEELNCFYRPIAIIFKYFKKEYFDLILFNISFYSSFMADSELDSIQEGGVDKTFMRIYENFLHDKFKIKFKKIEYSTPDEMHEKIKESIDNDSPVLVPVDIYGLVYYPMYKKNHQSHYCVIKGYDTQREMYNILDNLHIDNGASTIYKDFSAKFEDVYELNKLYREVFDTKSRKPFFWSISNERVNEEYYDIYQCILEHSNYLKQVNNNPSKIKYLEYEVIDKIQQGNLGESSNEKIRNMITAIIPIINCKAVYYDLTFKFLEKLNVSSKVILELKDIQKKLNVNWNNIRLNILDNVVQGNYEFKEIQSLVACNLEEERKYRQKFIEIVAQLEQMSIYNKAEKEKSNNNEFEEYNNKNAQILVGKKEIKFNLDSDKTYDIWISEDNGPQMLSQVSDSREFNIEGKLNLDFEMEEVFHDGIILKFKKGINILFGIVKEHLQDNKLVIYCPQSNDSYIIFEKLYGKQKQIYLKVIKKDSIYSFYYREGINDEWNNIKSIDTKDHIKNVGFFSKKWQFGKHSASISEIHYSKK